MASPLATGSRRADDVVSRACVLLAGSSCSPDINNGKEAYVTLSAGGRLLTQVKQEQHGLQDARTQYILTISNKLKSRPSTSSKPRLCSNRSALGAITVQPREPREIMTKHWKNNPWLRYACDAHNKATSGLDPTCKSNCFRHREATLPGSELHVSAANLEDNSQAAQFLAGDLVLLVDRRSTLLSVCSISVKDPVLADIRQLALAITVAVTVFGEESVVGKARLESSGLCRERQGAHRSISLPLRHHSWSDSGMAVANDFSEVIWVQSYWIDPA